MNNAVLRGFACHVLKKLEEEINSTDCWDNGSYHIILRTILDKLHYNWRESSLISQEEKVILGKFHRKVHVDITAITNSHYDDLPETKRNEIIMKYVSGMFKDAIAFSG